MFGATLRDDPAEAELASHRLMLKAGLIHQVSSGIYSYMPLALRSLRKIEGIIRDEMDAAGGQELRMSVLQPRELWQQAGRDEEYGPDMFRLGDRRDRPLVLAPTHEELLTTMVRANVNSYRDLPVTLYQIQTKFRDEPRPARRPHPRARVRHEGRVQLRHRRRWAGPELPGDGARLPEHL